MQIVQVAITIVLALVMLGVLILLHEVGHFVTARLFGMRVHEFAIGMGPRARVLRSKGETLYSLRWLPIGGYVLLEGEDGDSDDPRSFAVASLPKKLVVLPKWGHYEVYDCEAFRQVMEPTVAWYQQYLPAR